MAFSWSPALLPPSTWVEGVTFGLTHTPEIPLDPNAMTQMAEQMLRMVRLQVFHMGLVDLLNAHPAVDHIVVDGAKAQQVSRFKDLTQLHMKAGATAKEQRTAEAALSALRAQTGSNNREVIGDVTIHLGQQPRAVELNRATQEAYLALALGDALWGHHQRLRTAKALQATLDAQSLEDDSLQSQASPSRPRL